MCIYCKTILLDFIEVELNGNIDLLKSYDFTTLSEKYNRDSDRLYIINAIYCLHYSPLFMSKHCLFKHELFSKNCGDTLITYNSSFGNGAAGKRARHLIDMDKSNKLEDMKRSFFEIRHTIGNFMPLPIKTLNKSSINTARNSAFNDYTDLFIQTVQFFYSSNLNTDIFKSKYDIIGQRKGVINLVNVMIENVEYFKIFKEFDTFISYNHLDEFNINNAHLLFEHNLDFFHFKNTNDIQSFLLNSTSIIKLRSNSLVESLKSTLLI